MRIITRTLLVLAVSGLNVSLASAQHTHPTPPAAASAAAPTGTPQKPMMPCMGAMTDTTQDMTHHAAAMAQRSQAMMGHMQGMNMSAKHGTAMQDMAKHMGVMSTQMREMTGRMQEMMKDTTVMGDSTRRTQLEAMHGHMRAAMMNMDGMLASMECMQPPVPAAPKKP